MDDYTVTNADLAELGITVDENATAEQTNTQSVEQEQATAQSAESNASAEQNPQTEQPAKTNDRHSHAFAQLRTENKAMNQLITEFYITLSAKTNKVGSKNFHIKYLSIH